MEVIENEQNEDELQKPEKSKKKVVFFFCFYITDCTHFGNGYSYFTIY